ncbi:uncharacterized protein LOC120009311 [Tripterygium wilfordii]|uniref:uncharacterized protein LOC120009311 n=1 Tax=Tripterygium wilfordii TaxID=458696 RepID=UPI0018F852E5|nr:uncharacterized protein LOC120009311 [Tripterygium wilfordii]
MLCHIRVKIKRSYKVDNSNKLSKWIGSSKTHPCQVIASSQQSGSDKEEDFDQILSSIETRSSHSKLSNKSSDKTSNINKSYDTHGIIHGYSRKLKDEDSLSL